MAPTSVLDKFSTPHLLINTTTNTNQSASSASKSATASTIESHDFVVYQLTTMRENKLKT